jgi:hypothetical protein
VPDCWHRGNWLRYKVLTVPGAGPLIEAASFLFALAKITLRNGARIIEKTWPAND